MVRIFTISWIFILLLFRPDPATAFSAGSDKYTASIDACNQCRFQAGNTLFYDDGGVNGAVSNNYTLTTLVAKPGYVLSLYFTEIDLPKGARINVYKGEGINDENLFYTFFQRDKIKNIIGEKLTIEYIPSDNSNNAKGWEAHVDELIPRKDNITSKIASPPESDCPYAIPLCQNNTAVVLGGQYTDLGQIYDDEGSCYSGTGDGGSVWYSFSPQTTGPLDFTITPSGTTDYDFVVWDITNGCQENKRTQISCNYSLYTGITGMNSTLCTESYGSCSSNDCSNQSKGSDCNRFNNRVNVTLGRQYAICINFYSGSNDGFLIEFKKQATSVAITDATPPTITNAYSTNCSNASNFHLLFSEWVTCASIQNTDFTLAGHTFSIVNTNCVNGRTNNIDISVSPALTPGTYTFNAQNITDLCGNNMNSNYNVVLGAPPVPAISTPVLVCKSPGLFGGYNYSPGSQTLTASGGTSYYWYDGQTGPTAVFSATAPKTVSVTVVSGACAAIASKTINVEFVAVNLGPDQLYCGTPITLTATPAIPGSTYTFYRNPVFFPPSNGTQIQTGASNTISVSPASYTTYRVIVTSPNGCKAQDDVAITTNPPANATINVPGNNYCLGANPIVLMATPIGGTYTGPGMSNDTFYPAIAGIGTHNINYSVTNGCGTFTGTKQIKVIAGTLPTVNLNPTYCVTDANVTLSPNPACGSFSGPGITTAGFCVIPPFWVNQPVFSPSTAGIGTHTLTYSGSGCANTFSVQVLGAGAAPTITGAAGPYCTTSSPFTLTGRPTGGTFSGPGMTGSSFNPATAGVGTHTITYTVFACGNTLTNTVQIQVVSSSGSATISYSPNTFCNNTSTPQNVTRTGTAGGTYSASPAGLTIDPSTGAITPSTSSLNTYTVTYTIPAAGGCAASSTTTSVTITSGITPTFNAIGPFCQNATSPSLPATSTNSINGTWSPLTISTAVAGTSIYTFTPAAGQCASTKTVNITVKPTPTTNLSQSICQGSSIIFNGNTITTAGTYRDTLTTSLGCDSFLVLNVTIKPTPTTNLSQSICQGSSIIFNGNTITTAGTYRDTLTTSLGCDSFLVLNVTIKPTPTTNLSQSICQGSSMIFNGNTITTAGTYRDTLSTTLGCDSFLVLNVTIIPTPTTNISQSVCSGGSFVFNGNTLTIPGIYRDTLATTLGCDSFIVLNLSFGSAITTNLTQSICQGQSVLFNGNTLTTTGVYRDTLSTSQGCDSILILSLTVKPTPTTNLSQSICQGSSIVFNGNTISSAGIYRDTLSTSLGCDSFLILNVSVKPTPTTNLSQNICQGSSIVFNGNVVSTAGVYRDTLSTSLGCDSFIVLNVTVNPIQTTNISQSICQGSSISFNGNSLTASGIYRDTLSTTLGCDSFIVLNLNINPVVTTNISQSICQGSSIVFNGNIISTSGVYRDTLNTSLGCDSFLILNLSVKPAISTSISQNFCQGQTIIFNGNTISSAGIYRDTIMSSEGCDSIVILTVGIKPVISTNISQSICQGQSIVFNGNTLMTTGIYKDTLVTSQGCDSILILSLTVNPAPTTNLNQSICQGSSIIFNGNIITAAGIYRDTLTTSLGCDSFLVLNVSIKPTPVTNITQHICQGSSITFNGNTINSAGTYRDTLTTTLGCDSFVVLNVLVNPTPATNLIQSICQGNNISFNGNTISTAGTYRDTLSTSLGCDSIVVLTVLIKPTPTTNIAQSICPGNTVVFNGQIISLPGLYRDTLLTSLGCDSFVVLSLTISPTINSGITRSICQGQSTFFNGQTITSAGVYKDTLISVGGCDSVITLTVSVNPTPITNISRHICQGSNILFNGNTINTAGIYRDTLTTSLGCDSFIVLSVFVHPTPTVNIAQSICQGQSVLFNGQTLTTAGTYRDTLQTSLGCDSFVVLTLNVYPVKTTPTTIRICQGQSIIFNGNTLTTAGIYRDTLQTSLGCDSFVVLTLNVDPVKTTPTTRTICQGQSIVFNGNTLTTAGIYRDTLQTSLGCDSFIVLTLNVHPVKTTPLNRTICQGQSIAFNGNNLTTTGTYRDTLITSDGCDSIIVLTLTVNPVQTTPISRTICQGQAINFNGQTLSVASTYRDTLRTSLGCDSFIVLTLQVMPAKRSTQNPVICQGGAVTVGTHIYTVAGSYSDTLRSSQGCDSIVTTNLTVNANFTQSVRITSDTNNICLGQSVRFTATALNTGTGLSYQWFLNGSQVGNNSSVFTSTTLNEGDVVFVQIQSSAACLLNASAVSNTITVHVNTIQFSIPVVEYCTGQSSTVDLAITPSTGYSVLWKNGADTIVTQNSDSIHVNNSTSGNIVFTIRFGNGCAKSGTVPVTVHPLPVINATVDTPRTKYLHEVQLDVIHNGTLSYSWTPAGLVSIDSIRNPTSVIKATTFFTVEVRDKKNCINRDTILVELIDECQNEFIFIPTAFSPNNDGVNDCFGILSPPVLSEFKMNIFNRWGEKVFESDSPALCWDGTFKGSDAMVDSYIYVIQFRCYNGKLLSKKGAVTIVK
ncbi:MAG: gliding motility-associated C-terminal domain-containing protein [Chitinophagales bacterium]